jgi:hypothetical protein
MSEILLFGTIRKYGGNEAFAQLPQGCGKVGKKVFLRT